MKKGEKVHIY